MKMKSIYLILFIFYIFSNEYVNAQCIEGNQDTDNFFYASQAGLCQSFTVCEEGIVTSVAFYPIMENYNKTVKIFNTINSHQGNYNLVRTVENIPIILDQWNVVDMGQGFGPTYIMYEGDIFVVKIAPLIEWNNETVFVAGSSYNSYPGGIALNSGGGILAWTVNDFAIRIAMNNAPLPVGLSEIKVNNNKVQNIITFTTASEINNAGFDIERSSDGFDFQKIGWVDGHGSTSEEKHYTFIDTKPLPGMNYYRLRQMDYDGRFEYSHIVSVEKISDGVYLYPNPASDILNIQNAASGSYQIKSVFGTILGQGVLGDDSQIDISHFPQGTYLFYPESGKPLIFNKL
jgi:Secretion system C-terminal sorting domain